jgi:hypothetical protein
VTPSTLNASRYIKRWPDHRVGSHMVIADYLPAAGTRPGRDSRTTQRQFSDRYACGERA